MKPPRKIGAPPKRDPKPGERFQIGVRVTPEMKRRLEAAAEQSGRSLTQEAELRLERSFDRQDLLSEVLTTAYGSKQVAGIIMTIAIAFNLAGHQAVMFSQPQKSRDPAQPTDFWLSDPYAFAHAVESVIRVLETVRPDGDANLPKGQPGWSVAVGTSTALGVMGRIKSESVATEVERQVRALLGEIVERFPDEEASRKELIRKIEDTIARTSKTASRLTDIISTLHDAPSAQIGPRRREPDTGRSEGADRQSKVTKRRDQKESKP
jgi:TraY domain